MKPFLLKLSLLAVLPAASLVLAGCESAPMDNQTLVVQFNKGVPGGTAVETFQTTARIMAIHPANREATFVAADGSTNIFRAGPQVVNLDSYQAGVTMKIVVARELAMSLDRADPPTLSGAAAAAEAVPGVLPGIWMAEPVALTAHVTAVNQQQREATLHLSDGRTQAFKVRPDIDLTKVEVGTECYIRITKALAVLGEKP